MPHRTLAPVFAGLRAGMHVLFGGLLALVVVRVLVVAPPDARALTLAVALGLVYAAGTPVARRRRPGLTWTWVALLTAVWAALVWLVPEAAYLVFPLFFVYLHVLPGVAGPLAVVATTILTIASFALHGGLTVGGVVGPVVGAGVALLIGLGYAALESRAAEREALMAELLATRDRLAATEREQGVLAERARLAREIHDTVAQGLSSIQMLLHAAERADVDRPGLAHIRLARATAAEGLAETCRFIRELAPPDLDAGLDAALRRLAATWSEREGIPVEVTASAPTLPSMDVQAALLRVAQGALANVAQHADAGAVSIELTVVDAVARLRVRDDGSGFDASAVTDAGGATDSFGLRAMRERVDQLGGTLRVETAPGRGCVVEVVVGGGPE